MEEIIKQRIETYKEWREEIFANIKNSENIKSVRVIKWGEDLQKLEIKITELQSLL